MKEQMLEIDAALQIAAGMHEVYEAIVDPAKMANYFISRSTGRMEEGKTLTWHFPEFAEGFPVRIGKMEKDSYITYNWDVDGKELLVEITLSDAGNGTTLVRVTEKGMHPVSVMMREFFASLNTLRERCIEQQT